MKLFGLLSLFILKWSTEKGFRGESTLKSGKQCFVCDALLSETFGAWLHHSK